MTNKPMLSVEREFQEVIYDLLASPQHHTRPEYIAAYEKLRALLDRPVECLCRRYGKDNPHWPCPIHSQPAAQHLCEPTPITDGMDRLMEAYRLGEFSDEGGSDTVEALSVASFDAAESHGHDADSYMAGYCAALYEQAKPFIWLALKPKQQGEEVAKLGVHHVLGAIHNVPGFPGVKGNHIHDLTALLNDVLNGIEKPTIGLTSCEHEWLDDGQFLQMCPACGMTEDYTKAFELAFNHGGTDEGNYFLDEEELLEVIRCHVDQLGISNQISKSDKTKAELYDEVWKLAREIGYNNVTDALSVTPKKV